MKDITTLRIERAYHAPGQAVFDAWTSEEVMGRWWHAERDWETTEAEVDLRVGGVVRVVMRNPHKDIEYGGGGRYAGRFRPGQGSDGTAGRSPCAIGDAPACLSSGPQRARAVFMSRLATLTMTYVRLPTRRTFPALSSRTRTTGQRLHRGRL
jgi:hypothetical protein